MRAIILSKPIIRLLLPVLVGVLVYLAVLLAFDTVSSVLEDFFTRELLFCIATSYTLLEINRSILLLFEKRLIAHADYIKHVLGLLLSSILASIAITSALLIAYFSWFENMTEIQIYQTELQIFNAIFLFISLMYQGHYLGFYLIHKKFERELQAEQEEKEVLKRSIDHFNYMLNPEFLLVGMESILLKIKEKNYGRADEGVLLLSDIYRHCLRTQEELVPLKEELDSMLNTQVFLNRFVAKHILLQLPPAPGNLLIVPRTLTKILEAIACSQLSSTALPLHVNLEIRGKQLALEFPSNFSITASDQLFDALNMVKEQHAWLNMDLNWKNNSMFSVHIPLEMPFNLAASTQKQQFPKQ